MSTANRGVRSSGGLILRGTGRTSSAGGGRGAAAPCSSSATAQPAAQPRSVSSAAPPPAASAAFAPPPASWRFRPTSTSSSSSTATAAAPASPAAAPPASAQPQSFTHFKQNEQLPPQPLAAPNLGSGLPPASSAPTSTVYSTIPSLISGSGITTVERQVLAATIHEEGPHEDDDEYLEVVHEIGVEGDEFDMDLESLPFPDPPTEYEVEGEVATEKTTNPSESLEDPARATGTPPPPPPPPLMGEAAVAMLSRPSSA